MAKKLVKRRVAMPLGLLFVELLVPWLIMGMVAVLLAIAGFTVEIVFIVSIFCAVLATLLMREYERYRRRRVGKNA